MPTNQQIASNSHHELGLKPVLGESSVANCLLPSTSKPSVTKVLSANNETLGLGFDLLLYILTLLPAKDIIKCQQVCGLWNTIIRQFGRQLWRNFCRREFDITSSTPSAIAAFALRDCSWKEVYQTHAALYKDAFSFFRIESMVYFSAAQRQLNFDSLLLR
ncbi:hypothetical protein HDU91_007528, partial [Kappamyces sp. JEL0680]